MLARWARLAGRLAHGWTLEKPYPQRRHRPWPRHALSLFCFGPPSCFCCFINLLQRCSDACPPGSASLRELDPSNTADPGYAAAHAPWRRPGPRGPTPVAQWAAPRVRSHAALSTAAMTRCPGRVGCHSVRADHMERIKGPGPSNPNLINTRSKFKKHLLNHLIY